MTDDSDDEIASAGDFESAIGDLLDAALRNEVDVRGSWVCEPDDGPGDWEVMIHELE